MQTLLTKQETKDVGRPEERGVIGIAFLIWLFGGGLGLAVLIFLILKVF